MSHITKIKLYTSRRRWLIFADQKVSAEIWVDVGRLVVQSPDAALKESLEREIQGLVHDGTIQGVSVVRTKVPGRRDTVTHLVVPKSYTDEGFLGWLWESPVWDRVRFAGHTVIKNRSELLWSGAPLRGVEDLD